MAFHTSVANKTSCRSFCYSMTGCSYYTYHTLSDPDYPGACFLLSALQSPVRACSDCQTGVMDCSRKCFFLGEKDEITYGGVEITDSHQYTNLRPIALGNCLLVLVPGPRFNRRLDDPLNNPTNHPSNHPTKGLFSTGGKSPFYF